MAQKGGVVILVGDCRTRLRELPARSVQTCITSPPYFGLRDYGTGEWDGGDPACDHLPLHARRGVEARSSTLGGGKAHITAQEGGSFAAAECRRCGAARVDNQIGLEPTPDEFVHALVSVFREVRRVLRDDGTVWLNLGDSYASSPPGRAEDPFATSSFTGGAANHHAARSGKRDTSRLAGVKPKDLIGVPWMVAFALRADGWYLRSDIIWAKPNPMPESVTDRPTKAHEYLFLLSKGPRYFWDADAIREPHLTADDGRTRPDYEPDRGRAIPMPDGDVQRIGTNGASTWPAAGRNKRSVWTVATQPYAGAHFATFPPKLIEPCVLAGSPPKCCGVCGAPWRRVVERTAMVVRATPRREAWQAEDDHARTQTGGTMTEPPTSRTVGWEATCTHDDDTGRSIILDPFAGAGTVGVVCGWHGRDFTGIELNPAYAFMADTRIALEGRPGGPPNGHEPASPVAGQLGLLEGLG